MATKPGVDHEAKPPIASRLVVKLKSSLESRRRCPIKGVVCSHRAITRPQDDAAWRPLIACLDTVGSSQPSRMSSIIVESFWPMLPQVVFTGRSQDRPPNLKI